MNAYPHLKLVHFKGAKPLTSILNLRRYNSHWSENQIEYSPVISKKSKSCKARVSFTITWQQREDTVHQLRTENGWRFTGDVEYILPLCIKGSDWSGCEDWKIRILSICCNILNYPFIMIYSVKFMLTTIYVILSVLI